MDAKSHYDYLDEIGNTTETGRNAHERRWNDFYFQVHKAVVGRMLGDLGPGLAALDMGTSYGLWQDYLRGRGFERVFGIEVDPRRALAAQRRGYDQVFNVDGAQVPLEDESVDVAVSNGVFVHILRMEDKIAVLEEMQRLLKPGGLFIFNHTMAPAFGYAEYTVDRYLSYLTLDETLEMIRQNGRFRVLDLAPTYYHFRQQDPGRLTWLLRKAMRLPIPLLVQLHLRMQAFQARRYPLEASDSVYFKLQKPGGGA